MKLVQTAILATLITLGSAQSVHSTVTPFDSFSTNQIGQATLIRLKKVAGIMKQKSLGMELYERQHYSKKLYGRHKSAVFCAETNSSDVYVREACINNMKHLVNLENEINTYY